jgi:Tol biopolymer transport system component
MLALSSRYLIQWPGRSLAGLLALTMSLALGACGGEDRLAPEDAPDAGLDQVGAGQRATPGAAALAGSLQRVIFVTERNAGKAEVYSMDPLGANVKFLTASATGGSPVWSWDNKQVALIRWRLDNSNIWRRDIYVINADGSGGHWARPYAAAAEFFDPAWSPDGSRIVVTMLQNGHPTFLAWIQVATGAIVPVSPTAYGSEPSYDATGQKIVFVGPGDTTIAQINADGSGYKKRYTCSCNFIHHPRFSPDGKKIAFARPVGAGNSPEIFVKNLSDGTNQRLTSSSGWDDTPSWSPDGSKIVFDSDRTGKWQIYTMTATGGSQVRLTTTSYDFGPDWSH